MGTVDLRDFPILTQISHPDQAVPLSLSDQAVPISLFPSLFPSFPTSPTTPCRVTSARSWRFTTTSPASGSARFDGAVRRTVWRGRT